MQVQERVSIDEDIIREPATDITFEERYPQGLFVLQEPKELPEKEETEVITRRQVVRRIEVEALPEKMTFEEDIIREPKTDVTFEERQVVRRTEVETLPEKVTVEEYIIREPN